MSRIVITKTVRFHGDSVRAGSVFEADVTDGGWTIAHPRVEGARRMIPAEHAELVAEPIVGYRHVDGLVTLTGAM